MTCWTEGRHRTGARGPLTGLRVVDLTTVVMGPYATQILGDLGADVVKVEHPNGGDSLRGVGPFRNAQMGPLYLQNNRNKRSVALDLKTSVGMADLERLVEHADVVVSNIRPAAMGRLHLTYADFARMNPGVIVCNTVGYGSKGRRSGQAVYDDIIQAASGVAGLFEAVDGVPRYAPTNISDRTTALYAVIAILAALSQRTETGRGQEIEVPMFETMAQFVLADHLGGSAFRPAVGEMGYRRLLSNSRGPYPTADGYLTIVVYTDDQWRRFLPLVRAEGLLETDSRFESQAARTVHADEVGGWLAVQMLQKSTDEWLRLLGKADIPAARVSSLEDLLEDDHLRDVNFFVELEHPTEGMLTTTRFPIEYSETPCADPTPAPMLGSSTVDDVLASCRGPVTITTTGD